MRALVALGRPLLLVALFFFPSLGHTQDKVDVKVVKYAGLGEMDEFFLWANRASEEKTMNFGRLRLIDKEIPAMRNIRQDPRFIELFKKVGLEA